MPLVTLGVEAGDTGRMARARYAIGPPWRVARGSGFKLVVYPESLLR
ncbi:hypothetical protein JQX13_13050 [Archangium violaceum]|nr:hypothetical protein [Archangium violaceum]QRK10910.1 hypothetical protein JQX13_13050 [Archangium violaceum]